MPDRVAPGQAIGQVRRLAVLEIRDHLREPIRGEQIVAVEVLDVLTAREGASHLADEAGPADVVLPANSDPFVGERELLADRPGFVGRAVVDDDDLEFGVGLGENALHGFDQHRGSIEHGNDRADGARFFHRMPSKSLR